MNRILSKALFILFCISLFSCKKDESKTPDPVKDGSRLNFVIRDSEPIKELTYTFDSLIYELIEPNSYKKYVYNPQRQLERIDQAFSISPFSCAMAGGSYRQGDNPRQAPVTQYFTYEYIDNKISKQSAYYNINNTPTLINYQTYEYENNRVSKISEFNPSGKLLNYYKYAINESGNLTRKEFYVIDNTNTLRLISANEYQYDSKLNPFRIFACEGEPGINTNTNNIIKDTYISYTQASENRTSTDTSYEYNTYDYPANSGDLSFFYFDPLAK